MELLEPTATRGRELESGLHSVTKTVNGLRRKQDETDFAIEKLKEKNLGQDELVEKIGVVDQSAKFSEINCLNQISVMIQ